MPPGATKGNVSGRGLRVLPRHVKGALIVATLLQLFLGLVWSTAQMPYRGVDEPNHEGAVLQLAYHHTWPDPGTLQLQAGVVGTFDAADDGGLLKRVIVPAPARSDRPTLATAGGAVPSAIVNQMSQHPPLAYGVDAVVLRLFPSWQHWNYDRVLFVLRLLSALLLAPLPLLFFAGARRLGLRPDMWLAAAFVPLLLPTLSRLGGSVTNDSMLILLTSALAVATFSVLTGDLSKRMSMMSGVLTMLALLTKGTALVLPLWLAFAFWRGAHGNFPRAARAALPALPFVVLGGAWWIRNVISFKAIQPAGYHPFTPRPGRHNGFFFSQAFTRLADSSWSTFGSLFPPRLPLAVGYSMSIGILALALLAVILPPRPLRRVDSAILLFPFLAILGVVLEGVYTSYRTYDLLPGLQGRYLFPALLPLTMAALAGAQRLLPRGLMPALVLGGAAAMQTAAFVVTIRYFWSPVDSPNSLRKGFRAMEDWAPFEPTVTRAVWVVAVVLGIALAALTAWPAISTLRRTWSSRTPSPLAGGVS